MIVQDIFMLHKHLLYNLNSFFLNMTISFNHLIFPQFFPNIVMSKCHKSNYNFSDYSYCTSFYLNFYFILKILQFFLAMLAACQQASYSFAQILSYVSSAHWPV